MTKENMSSNNYCLNSLEDDSSSWNRQKHILFVSTFNTDIILTEHYIQL